MAATCAHQRRLNLVSHFHLVLVEQHGRIAKLLVSKACNTGGGPTARKSSTYTKMAATCAHSPKAAKSGKSLSSGKRTVGGRLRHGARTTNHKLG